MIVNKVGQTTNLNTQSTLVWKRHKKPINLHTTTNMSPIICCHGNNKLKINLYIEKKTIVI